MHIQTESGNDFFRCDFCLRSWAEQLPMVEGHKGSLICIECLTDACREVIVQEVGTDHHDVTSCTMCLQHRESLHWQRSQSVPDVACTPEHDASELVNDSDGTAAICEWCIVHSAGVMEQDPDAGWVRPGGSA